MKSLLFILGVLSVMGLALFTLATAPACEPIDPPPDTVKDSVVYIQGTMSLYPPYGGHTGDWVFTDTLSVEFMAQGKGNVWVRWYNSTSTQPIHQTTIYVSTRAYYRTTYHDPNHYYLTDSWVVEVTDTVGKVFDSKGVQFY